YCFTTHLLLLRCRYRRRYAQHLRSHSFPTRRSSDLVVPDETLEVAYSLLVEHELMALPVVNNLQERRVLGMVRRHEVASAYLRLDRKSTRLNSSHVKISYAVFCLKKKNKTTPTRIHN